MELNELFKEIDTNCKVTRNMSRDLLYTVAVNCLEYNDNLGELLTVWEEKKDMIDTDIDGRDICDTAKERLKRGTIENKSCARIMHRRSHLGKKMSLIQSLSKEKAPCLHCGR